jgi:hypothetical protein
MTKLCPRCIGTKGYGDIISGWTPCERCDGTGLVPGSYLFEHCLIHSSTSTTVTDHRCLDWMPNPDGSLRIIPVLGDEISLTFEAAFDGIHKAVQAWPDNWMPFRHGDAEHPHTWVEVLDQGPSAKRCSCGAIIGSFWADTPFITGEFPIENIVDRYNIIHRSHCPHAVPNGLHADWAGCHCGQRGREHIQIMDAARLAIQGLMARDVQ